MFTPFLIAAAGLAAERGDGPLADVLSDLQSVDVGFAEYPVTWSGAHAHAAVEVTLYARAADAGVESRLVGLLNEIVEADGYHVTAVHVREGGAADEQAAADGR